MAVAVGSRSRYSLNFDGSSGYVVLGTPLTATGDFTWHAWVMFSSVTGNRLFVSNSGDSGACFIGLLNSSSVISVRFSVSILNFTVPTLSTGVWYSVAVVRSSGTVRLYLNGTESSSGGFGSTDAFSWDTFGAYALTIAFSLYGSMDDVSFSTATTSAGDIGYLAAGLIDPASLSSLVALYHMKEGTGTTTFDSSGTDNGTLNGGVTWSSGDPSTGDVPAYLQDYTTSGYKTAAGANSTNYRLGAGSNRLLRIGVKMLSVAGSSVTGVTVNGSNASYKGSIASVSGAIRVEVWEIVAPDVPYGSPLQTVVTFSASLVSIVDCIGFTGVDQTTPSESLGTASATNIGTANGTVTITTATDNCYIVADIASDDTGSMTVGTGQTEDEHSSGTLGSGAQSYKGPIHPAGSATMYWSVAALKTWSIISNGIRPAGATVFPSEEEGFYTITKYVW